LGSPAAITPLLRFPTGLFFFNCGSAGLQLELFSGDRPFGGWGGLGVSEEFLREFQKFQIFIHGEGTARSPQPVLYLDILRGHFDIPLEINHLISPPVL
jgi:hypothetical protein